jgi:hypothetical protein
MYIFRVVFPGKIAHHSPHQFAPVLEPIEHRIAA